MNSLLLLVIAALLLLFAYFNYGGFLSDIWGIDTKKITPAYSKYDRKSYIPVKGSVLNAEHIGAIIGAGAIAGPIQAAVFGWVPVYLWIIIGAIFIGGVLDFASVYVSLRSGGKSLYEIIKDNLGDKCAAIFYAFSLIVIVFLTSAFISIISGAFEKVPGAAIALIFFIVSAALYKLLTSKLNINIAVSTVICLSVIILGVCMGYRFPYIKLSRDVWYAVLILYVFITLIFPDWTANPSEYLNSFITIAILAISIIGIIIARPYTQTKPINIQPVKSGSGVLYLFPMAFCVTACGAVSGFHSLIASNITARKIENEKDARPVAYGSMLIEGVVAIVSMTAVICIANEDKALVDFNSAPLEKFAYGISNLVSSLKIPEGFISVFAIFAFSGLALGGVNSAMGLVKNLSDSTFKNTAHRKYNIKKIIFEVVPIFLSLIFLKFGYYKLWIMFGISNEILAVLSFTAISVWLIKNKKNSLPVNIPLFALLFISVSSCIAAAFNFWVSGDYLLLAFIIAFSFALYPVCMGFKAMIENEKAVHRRRMLYKMPSVKNKNMFNKK